MPKPEDAVIWEPSPAGGQPKRTKKRSNFSNITENLRKWHYARSEEAG
jgi:hypothetical protein